MKSSSTLKFMALLASAAAGVLAYVLINERKEDTPESLAEKIEDKILELEERLRA
jgi:hypothetical protein